MPLPVGTQLGYYRIIAPVGKGGMGEVFRALDIRLNREVAVKVLPESLANNPDALKRFEREAQVLAALAHPNILTIYDIGTDQNVFYLVMELLEGETLRLRLDRSPLSWQNAIQTIIPIAEGLSAAHSKGIIHRDLKPENIFLMTGGHVKILDFGLARMQPELRSEEITEANTVSESQTDSQFLVGTLPYMSPEQVCGAHLDARSDIFSLGCILHEMMSGQRLFKRAANAQTAAAILKEDPPKLSDMGKDVPPEVEQFLEHCLEKNKEKRFQNVRDLAFALRQILNTPVSSRTVVPLGRVFWQPK